MPLIQVRNFSKNVITSESGVQVEFDGYLTVNEVNNNIVTKRPIENGYDITDAIHNSPKLLRVEIIITDTAQSIIDKRSITNLPNILGTKFVQTHTKRQIDKLQQISNDKETVSLKSKYSEYNDYFLENFSFSETDEEALRISFDLSENRIDLTIEALSNIDSSIGAFS